jgi:hypothetical protein
MGAVGGSRPSRSPPRLHLFRVARRTVSFGGGVVSVWSAEQHRYGNTCKAASGVNPGKNAETCAVTSLTQPFLTLTDDQLGEPRPRPGF